MMAILASARLSGSDRKRGLVTLKPHGGGAPPAKPHRARLTLRRKITTEEGMSIVPSRSGPSRWVERGVIGPSS